MSEDAGMSPGTYLSIAAIGVAGVGAVYNNMEIRKLQGNMNEQGTILHSMIKKVAELNTLNRGVESVTGNVRELKQLVHDLSQNHNDSNHALEQIIRKLAMQEFVLQEYVKSINSLIKVVAKNNPEADIYIPQRPNRHSQPPSLSQHTHKSQVKSNNSHSSQIKSNRRAQSSKPTRSTNARESNSRESNSRVKQGSGVQFADEDDLLLN